MNAIRSSCIRVLHEILAGDEASANEPSSPRSRAGNLHSGESGMISLVTMVAVLFFLILFGLLANVGMTVNQKIEVQNGADSVAYSTSLALSRTMNAVTGINHVVGEAVALCVLHHAIGGPELDQTQGVSPLFGDKESLTADDKYQGEMSPERLDLAYQFAVQITKIGSVIPKAPTKSTKERVEKKTKSGATVYRSVYRLQQVLAAAYWIYSAGAILQQLHWVPIVGPVLKGIGIVLCVGALLFELKCNLERMTINAIEMFAQKTVTIKRSLLSLVRTLVSRQRQLADQYSFRRRCQRIVNELEGRNLVTCQIYPRVPQIPITTEKVAVPIQKSQLLRATFPWVNYWRDQPLELMSIWLLLARSAHQYKHFSDRYSRDICDHLRRKNNVRLQILKDLDLVQKDKGSEPWTTRRGSRRADELFGVMGFAHRDRPPLASSGFYRHVNPDGIVAFAQALTYNANPQLVSPGQSPAFGTQQPRVGWDTLNWNVAVPEFRGVYSEMTGELRVRSYVPRDEPKIFLNWQTKLVPATQLPRSVSSLRGNIRQSIRRTLPLQQFRTH